MTKKQIKLAAEIKAKLEIEALSKHYESAHVNADDLLCELLKKLGFTEVVEAFDKVHKWYA